MDRIVIDKVIQSYVQELRRILKDDFSSAVLYGSYARGEDNEDSDIDIVIFTSQLPDQYDCLFDKIAEITFEFNVQYDIELSPVFQNIQLFDRMKKAVPYFQNIQKEGILVGH
jgi:predicted nucleotidyltransferase